MGIWGMEYVVSHTAAGILSHRECVSPQLPPTHEQEVSMSTEFMQKVNQRYAAALASGALECIRLDRVEIEAEGLSFVVQWPSTMAAENETSKPSPDKSENSQRADQPRQLAKTETNGGSSDNDNSNVSDDSDDSGGPASSPFLPPDPELTVGPVGEHHVALLNKFPVCARHLVLARTE